MSAAVCPHASCLPGCPFNRGRCTVGDGQSRQFSCQMPNNTNNNFSYHKLYGASAKVIVKTLKEEEELDNGAA